MVKHVAFASVIMALGWAMDLKAQAVRTDPKAVFYMATGYGHRYGYEKLINDAVEETTKEQEDKEKMVAQMTAITEGMKEVMSNVQGFGVESAFYKQMIGDMQVIGTKTPLVLTEIGKRKGLNAALALTNVSRLVERATGLVDNFCNIVNNGTVENPFKRGKKDNDKDNYMQREKRLGMAILICSDIAAIRRAIEVILINYQYGTWIDVWMRLDYESWAKIVGMEYNARYAIGLWNNTFNK